MGAMARSFLESIREFPNPEWLGFPSLALTLLYVWMCKKESIKNRSHDLLATWRMCGGTVVILHSGLLVWC